MNAKQNPLGHSRLLPGFTLTELLVVIVVIAILAAFSLVGVQSVREKARLANCAGNLKTWGVAIMGYAAENNGAVQWSNWASISNTARYYETYLGGNGLSQTATMDGKRVLHTQLYRRCPSQTWDGTGNGPVGYGMIRPNPKIPSSGSYSIHTASNPSQLLWMIEAHNALSMSSPGELVSAVEPLTIGEQQRHRRTINALFADGHVSPYQWSDLKGSKEQEDRLNRWFTLK